MSVASRAMFMIGALAFAGWGDAAPARNPDTIVLTNSSPPSATKVWPGQPVEIRLKAQAGTGFSWQPTNWQSMIRELGSHEASRPGGKEVQRFLFRTKSKGTYFVNFTYGQLWKGGTKGARSRSFTIEVH